MKVSPGSTARRAVRNLVRGVLSVLVVVLTLVTVPTARAVVAGTITGSVTVPAGYDVRAVRVVATTPGNAANAGASPEAWVQPDGTFTLTGLAAGSYNVAFGTYWSDMYPCSYNRDRWWTSPGQANGTCAGGVLTGATLVTVADGVTTDLGSTPLLTSFATYRSSGKLVAAPGHTTAGVVAELWLSDDGAWLIPSGWYRLSSVPAQTLTANGEFSFDLIDPPWGHHYAVRFVDQPANGYAYSFGTGGLTSSTPALGGADFGAGSVGLLAVPQWSYQDNALGSHQLKFDLDYVSGGVSVSGTPEWGRTLTAHQNVVWSNPAAGTGFQWYRSGVAIDGATGPTYVLNGWDDGWQAEISVRAVPGGAWAFNGTPVQSPTLVIQNTTPYNATAPSTSGSARVGQVLTAKAGSWRPTAATFDYGYRWFRGSTPIAGATRPTYAPTTRDLGSRLRVEVTASNPPACASCPPWFSGPGVARSAPGPVVQAGVLAPSWIAQWPVKVGSARAGRLVRVRPLRLSAAGRAQQLKVSYRWYVDGKQVKGAATTAFKVKKAHRRHTITVRVTVTKPGFTARIRTISFGRAR